MGWDSPSALHAAGAGRGRDCGGGNRGDGGGRLLLALKCSSVSVLLHLGWGKGGNGGEGKAELCEFRAKQPDKGNGPEGKRAVALAASWTRPFPAAWEVWQQPLCGTGQTSQGPTVLRSGTLCLPGRVGVRSLELEVCGPSQITACGEGGSRAGRAPGQGGCLAGTPVIRWTGPVGTEAPLSGGTLTEQRQAGEIQTGLGAISRAQLPLIAPSVWV